MKRIATFVPALALAALAGCAAAPTAPDSTAAQLFGPFAAAMDASDRERAIGALDSNHEALWRNAATGRDFRVNPDRTYASGVGRLCRDYTISGVVDGRRVSVEGSACRQSDGRWTVG
jgi:surface antigen